MSFDPVPWFVGGGAQHSPEVARLLAYAAFGGREGVVGKGDLKVSAQAVPGASVRVAPGACAILNRASGGQYQAYAGRVVSEVTVPIAATDSSGGRSDLIVARVEDPYMPGEPWDNPADPTVGPYIFARVIPGVPAGTTTVEELGLGYSAIPLARIDIPASTATITNAMIADLRSLVNPRRQRNVISVGLTGSAEHNLTSSSYTRYPLIAAWSVWVPPWAVQLRVIATWAQIQNVSSADTYGSVRVKLGSVVTQDTVYDSAAGTGSYRTNLVCADTVTVPSSMRGTWQTLEMQGLRKTERTGYLQMDGGSAVVVDYEFLEVAE